MALTKADSQVLTVTATDVGLGNVTNESKATMFTGPTISNPTFTGTVGVEKVLEKVSTTTGNGNTTFDYTNGTVWHITVGGAVVANFINVPTTDARVTTFTIMVQQGSPAYLITTVTVNGTAVTIQWQGNITPSGGTANRKDVFTFSVLRLNSVWQVLGSMSSF